MRYTPKSIRNLRSGQTTWRVWAYVTGPMSDRKLAVEVDRKCLQGKLRHGGYGLGMRIGPNTRQPGWDSDTCGYLLDRLGIACFNKKHQAERFAQAVRDGYYPDVVASFMHNDLIDREFEAMYHKRTIMSMNSTKTNWMRS